MKRLSIIFFALIFCTLCQARNVTVQAVDQPAAMVFRSIVEQTGMNFVYSSDILKDLRVTVNVDKKPLKQVLNTIFHGTDIEYTIKGKNIVLKKRKKAKPAKREAAPLKAAISVASGTSASTTPFAT